MLPTYFWYTLNTVNLVYVVFWHSGMPWYALVYPGMPGIPKVCPKNALKKPFCCSGTGPALVAQDAPTGNVPDVMAPLVCPGTSLVHLEYLEPGIPGAP